MRTTVPPRMDWSCVNFASILPPAIFATSATSDWRSSLVNSRAVTISAGRMPNCSCSNRRYEAATSAT